MAQCLSESMGFTRFEENLFYTTPERIRTVFPSRVTSLQQAATLTRNPEALANCVYSGKNGNGNPLSGDGWKYRGRGPIQLTGRSNYTDAAADIGRPYIDQPNLVAQPTDGLMTAAWFWSCRKANLLADSAQWDAITRMVNGPAMLGHALRAQMSDEATRAFS